MAQLHLRDETFERSFPLDASSPRQARRFVSDILTTHDRLDVLDVAVLLVSELVTNATVHAGGGGTVRVRCGEHVVRVEVEDRSSNPPVMRARNVEADSGRGILLVEELADAWGVEVDPTTTTKVVWFELGAVDGFGHAEDPGEALEQAFSDLFPRVVHDAPAAILLVDLDKGQVTFANTMAQDLAPATVLPCRTDDWSAAADLRDPAGHMLDETASPLSKVAQGMPVAGEPVTVADRTAPGGRRMVWVIGFPLAGGPTLARQALVVFFEVAGSLGDGEASGALQAMRDRAVVATDISFTISDPHQPDNPLVWANPAFFRMTGYEPDEVLGRNCRFLQGSATDAAAIDEIRQAIAEDRPITRTLLNYRKDGSAFWNELAISPVFDAEGNVIHHVGVQADVTARVQVEQEREAAFRAERRARADAEAAMAAKEGARAQMALLAEVTTLLTATLDVEESIQRLVGLMVPAMADCCTVEVDVGPTGRRRRFTNRGDGVAEDAGAGTDSLVEQCQPLADAVADVADGGEGALLRDLEHLPCDGPVLHSAVVVPLRARRRMLGTMVWVSTEESGRRYDGGTLELATDLARRAALALDNARLYTREHEIAEDLQRSLLPTLPTIDKLLLAERYLASSERADVGGDWFDALPLPDGSVGLAIGDVMGHDMGAAAAMSQLRGVLRSYAWEGGDVASVLERLDRLVQGLEMAQLATAVYARLEPADASGDRLLRYANAGHLPPLLLCPDGTVESLDEAHSVLIGAAADADREEASVRLSPGSTLLLYTDGLVERRGEDLSTGLAALAAVVAEHDPGDHPEQLCDRVLKKMLGDAVRDDDVALLAVTLR